MLRGFQQACQCQTLLQEALRGAGGLAVAGAGDGGGAPAAADDLPLTAALDLMLGLGGAAGGQAAAQQHDGEGGCLLWRMALPACCTTAQPAAATNAKAPWLLARS